MSILPQPPVKQQLFAGSAPSFLKNPAEDFLAGFKEQKTDLETKLGNMVSGGAVKTDSQEINESNWSQFQGADPMKPSYQPQSLIDYYRTGKTTSDMMNSGDVKVDTNSGPIKMSYQTPEPSGITKFVSGAIKGIDNLTGGKVSEGLQSMTETPASSPTELLGSFAQGTYDAAKKIKDLGYADVSPEKEAKIKAFIKEKLDAGVDPEIIKQALKKAKDEGKLRGGWTDNPVSGTIASVVSAPLQGASTLFGGQSKFTEGVTNMIEGDKATGSAQMVEGVLGSGMGALGLATGFNPVGAGVNTAFNSDTVAEPMSKYIVEPTKKVTAVGQELLGFDPNSEASKSVQESAGILGPLAVLGAGQKYAPKVISKGKNIGEAILPKVEGVVSKAGEKVSAVGEKISTAKDRVGVKYDEVVTGLDEGSIKGIQANPYLKDYWTETVGKMKSEGGVLDPKQVTTEFISRISDDLRSSIDKKRSSIGEDGPVYKEIRKYPQPIDIRPVLERMKSVFDENGLTVKDGEVIKVEGLKSAEINTADLAKINALIKGMIADAGKKNGSLTAGEMLDARKIASNLAKYDANTTTQGTSVIRGLRSSIDQVAKEKIKGLREIDKNFADKLESLNQLEDGLIYKVGDKKGQFKDNFDNYIKNINNDAKSAMKKRLDEVMPDLATRIEAVNRIPRLFEKYTSGSPLVREGVKFALSVGGSTLGFAGALVGYLTGSIAGKGLSALQKNAIDKAVGKLSEAGKKNLEEINKKIQKNIELEKADKEFIQKIKDDVSSELSKQEEFAKDTKSLTMEKSKTKEDGQQLRGVLNSGNRGNSTMNNGIPSSNAPNTGRIGPILRGVQIAKDTMEMGKDYTRGVGLPKFKGSKYVLLPQGDPEDKQSRIIKGQKDPNESRPKK